MATESKTETSKVRVPGKGKVEYSFPVLSGKFDDALVHAGNNAELLGEAYFDNVNAKAKASARQKAYTENIDETLLAKINALRATIKATGMSREEVLKIMPQLDPGVVAEDTDEE